MKQLIVSLLQILTGACLALAPITAMCQESTQAAEPLQLLSLRETSVKYQQYFQGGVDPMITGEVGGQLDKELNLNVNTDVLKYGFWNNTVHSQTDQFQFRKIGWELQLGVRCGKYLDVYYEHYSQHFLDYAGKGAFPRNDGVGIKLYLYRKDW